MITHMTDENCRSSLLEKLPPEIRRKVDIAILERLIPNIRTLWMHFELGKHGVTYIALYRYARRLRDRANLAELSDYTSDQIAGLDENVHSLITRRVIEKFLDDDELDSRDVRRLVSTLRLMARTDLEKKKLSEESRLAWARVDNERKALQLSEQKLQLFRRNFVDPPRLESLPIDDATTDESNVPAPLKLANAPEEADLLAASLPRPDQTTP